MFLLKGYFSLWSGHQLFMTNKTQTQTMTIKPQNVRQCIQTINRKVFSIKLENSLRDAAVPLPASDALVLGRVKTYWPGGRLSCNYSSTVSCWWLVIMVHFMLFRSPDGKKREDKGHNQLLMIGHMMSFIGGNVSICHNWQHNTPHTFVSSRKWRDHYITVILPLNYMYVLSVLHILCHSECQLSNLHLLLIYFLKQSHKQP